MDPDDLFQSKSQNKKPDLQILTNNKEALIILSFGIILSLCQQNYKFDKYIKINLSNCVSMNLGLFN